MNALSVSLTEALKDGTTKAFYLTLQDGPAEGMPGQVSYTGNTYSCQSPNFICVYDGK